MTDQVSMKCKVLLETSVGVKFCQIKIKTFLNSDHLATNENSLDIFMQYNEIKTRLTSIEGQLDRLNKTIDSDQVKQPENNQNLIYYRKTIAQQHQKAFKVNEALKTEVSNNFFNPTNMLIALIAWFIGLISAVVSNKLLQITIR